LRFIYFYAEFHYAKCCYAGCHYAECHYAECHYAEYYYAKCCYAKCHYAECRYAECRVACPNSFVPFKQAVCPRRLPKALSTIIEALVVCLRFGENGQQKNEESDVKNDVVK
jgi:hypothetical protein